MRKVTIFLTILVFAVLTTSAAMAANGRIRQIQIVSACPTQTVTSSGQTIQLSSTCLADYKLLVGQTGAGSLPHTYRLVWAGGSRGPAYGSGSYYQFNSLSGARTYTVYIDEGAGGEIWTVTVAAAPPSASLTVLTPNGGENWASGSTATVTWTIAGLSPSSYVKIQLNRTYPTGNWETVVAFTLNDGTHSFTLMGAASTSARVRVISATDPAVGDTSDGNFMISAVPARMITVQSPNGGETWVSGSIVIVTWTSAGLNLTDYVKIFLNRSYPTGLWETISSSTANDGMHSFTLDGGESTTARVRVISYNYASVGDTSNSDFIITGPEPQSLTVTAPNGGESWTLGNTYEITWASSGLADENVKIDLQRGYPGGIWETLTESTPNTGTWPWTPTGIASAAARIRIIGTVHITIADNSDASFALVSGSTEPSITVTLPNGGEYWPVGSSQNILWTSSNLPENVMIEVNRSYPTDDWELLAAATANDGIFPWTIAGSVTGTARVRISGTINTAVTDVSDAMFTISGGGSGGGITVTGPNGGDLWLIGTTRTITWSAPTLTGNVKIEINRQFPAGAWSTIISSTANDGVHSWLVTPSSTTGARVRISSVTSPTTHDVSDGAFTIATNLVPSGPGVVNGTTALDGPTPKEAYLAPNYPNPFNPSTAFEFGVPEAANVSLKVYDVTGREVVTLLEGAVAAGRHRVLWNCADYPAGVYMVVLSGNGFRVVQKATFLK